MKISVSIDEELMKRIDEYADDNYLSRSGAMSMACNQFLNEAEAGKGLKVMAEALKKMAETGKADAESMKKLEDFEKLVKLITGTEV